MSILLSHGHSHRHPPRTSSSPSPLSPKRPPTFTSFSTSNNNLPKLHSSFSIGLLLSLTLTLNSPLPSFGIPSLTASEPPPKIAITPTTPFSQSKDLPLGLLDGRIRPCPSINPGCVSSNPMSSSFSFPWSIPSDVTSKGQAYALQQLKEAVLTTQKNPKIMVSQDTPFGHYLQAEVDGGFSRDILEFLVKGDVVFYRCMATKVTYVYPFTTALGDSKGQEERLKRIVDHLGWFAPGFEGMD